jgi:hypothetical protein
MTVTIRINVEQYNQYSIDYFLKVFCSMITLSFMQLFTCVNQSQHEILSSPTSIVQYTVLTLYHLFLTPFFLLKEDAWLHFSHLIDQIIWSHCLALFSQLTYQLRIRMAHLQFRNFSGSEKNWFSWYIYRCNLFNESIWFNFTVTAHTHHTVLRNLIVYNCYMQWFKLN